MLHPELESLGANHDFVEANAFAKIAVAAQPAVAALLGYCRAEATALLRSNRDMLDALVEALVEQGTLDGDQVDETITACMTARLVTVERQRRADWLSARDGLVQVAGIGVMLLLGMGMTYHDRVGSACCFFEGAGAKPPSR